ncbi:MAG: [Fe-Fe] hydrogenase large subunit C-terminal domain-containing protein, partial [Christensenellaceae bacterium]
KITQKRKETEVGGLLFPNGVSIKTSKEDQDRILSVIVNAERNGIDPAKIFTVSVMPCTAKKYEKDRAGQNATGYSDVDAVITTREIASMIKEANIDFVNLPDEDFDEILGTSSGAGVIFGATGGVMEAALRTVADVLTGKDLENIEFTDVRGISGIKEATVKIGDLDVNVAIASGTGNAKKLLETIKAGEKNYHFIEIMACPGGCVNGGGQPIVSARIKNVLDPRVVRAKGLYDEDNDKPVRKSHKNPDIHLLYKEYLGEPNGHKAHELLHTFYEKKEK